MNEFIEAAISIEGKVIEWRRELHKIPEISHYLPKTSEFVLRQLESIGVDKIIRNVGILDDGTKNSCGIIAEVNGELPGKTLAIRADMDALPVREDSGVPFASNNGNMHACGHDFHTAMLLGVAELVSARRKQLAGKVRFIFQPAEETTSGADAMVRDGVMDGVDMIVGLHTGTLWNGGKPGAVGFRTGGLMASSDRITVTFKGKGGHGAMPHLTVDPILMACQAVCQLQSLVSREVSPLSSAVVTVGMISGGSVSNIIPDTVCVKGTIRVLDPELRKRLRERVAETVESVAKTMRGSAEVEIVPASGVVFNDGEVVGKMARIAESVLGKDMSCEVSEPVMVSEDFSSFLEKARGAFFFHNATFGDSRDMPHHNSKFQLNEATFRNAVAVMTAFAMNWGA